MRRASGHDRRHGNWSSNHERWVTAMFFLSTSPASPSFSSSSSSSSSSLHHPPLFMIYLGYLPLGALGTLRCTVPNHKLARFEIHKHSTYWLYVLVVTTIPTWLFSSDWGECTAIQAALFMVPHDFQRTITVCVHVCVHVCIEMCVCACFLVVVCNEVSLQPLLILVVLNWWSWHEGLLFCSYVAAAVGVQYIYWACCMCVTSWY